VWCPYKKGDNEIIEKVKKRATKLIISLKHILYSERLKQLQLPTLKYRRLRGNIETRATLAAVYWLTSAAAGICLVAFLRGLRRLSWAPPYFSQNTETRASGSD